MELTREFLVAQLKCCGNGCNQCPYYPKASKSKVLVRKLENYNHIECSIPCNIKTMREGLCNCFDNFMNKK